MQIFYGLLLIASLLFSQSVFASEPVEEEITKYKITSISYSNDLVDGVEVKISGENLDKCDSISHAGKKLDIDKPSFIYSDNKLNGIVSIDCDGVVSNYEYGFPYIQSTKVVQEDSFFYVEINGKNFDKDSKVEIEGLSFEKIYNSQTKIYGKLIGEVEDLELFVTSDSNDSNIVELDFAYPKIEKIESKTGFLANTKIYIHGKNLGNFDMYVNQKRTTDFEIKNNIIEYTLPNKIEDVDIMFDKYNLSSNEITLRVQAEIPYITKLYEKNDSDSQTNQVLEIHGENFPFYDEDVKVFLNDEQLEDIKVSNSIIRVNNFEFEDGDNYIYIEVNDYRSNTLYKYKQTKLPYPTSIVDINFEDDERILTLGVTDFDEETDKIYVNGSAVKILSCYSSVCRIAINKSLLNGKITVKRGDLQHKNFVEFDYSTGQHPHISKIVFQEDPKGLTKYTLYGYNFLGSDISGSNIYTLKSNNNPDIEVSNDKIKARLPRDYKNKNSSINISKYGLSSQFSFSYDEIENKTVKNAPLILDLEPENGSFLQSGKMLFIKGYGFNSGDKIFIGDKSYSIDFSQGYNYPQLKLSSNIETGFYDVYIQSTNEKKSKSIKKFISQTSNPQINFTPIENTKNEFYYNNNSSDPLFSMKINNGIEDIRLSQIDFIVQGSDNVGDFGELDLYIDNKKIAHSFVDEDGKITFLEEIILEKTNSDIILEIKKADKFFAQGKYRISYLGQNTFTANSNQQVFIDKKVFNGNYFTVGLKDFYNCYNSEGTNVSCDEAEEKNQDNTQEENKNEIKEETQDNSNQDNSQDKDSQKSSMEQKIDAVVQSLYKSKTKKSTYSGLIYFKNLKLKLARVIDDVPDSHKDKKLLVYLQKSIEDTYTIIFKQYVAEQKNK